MRGSSKQRIIHAFESAIHYHRDAHVQRRVADTLADMLFQYPCPPDPQVVELGCGTGFLSHRLDRQWPASALVLSDMSWSMVRRCRANLEQGGGQGGGQGGRRHRYVVLDGEHLALVPGFDIIASSMAFQWFSHPIAHLAALSRVLRPGGVLAFATLGPQTFQVWRQACLSLGVASGLPDYPSADRWREGWAMHGPAAMREETITVTYPSSLAFVRDLKAIGAHLPRLGYRAQPAGVLRRLLRYLDGGGGGGGGGGEFAITYHLLYGIFAKQAGGRDVMP